MNDYVRVFKDFGTVHPTPSDRNTWAGLCGALIYRFVEASGGWAIKPRVTGPYAINVMRASNIVSAHPSTAPVGAFHWWSEDRYGHVGIDLRGGGIAVGMATSASGHAVGLGLVYLSVASYGKQRPGFAYQGWSTDYAQGRSAWESEEEPLMYTIVRGDTLIKIARQFGTSVRQLVAWNGIRNPDLIIVGQILRVA